MNCRQCGKKNGINPASGLCANCAEHQANPDALSKRKTLAGIPFVDMKKVDEKKRYDLIVKYLKENPGRCTAVMVESGGEYEGKGDRYIAGIRELIPDVELVSRKPGPVPETETILLRIKA